MRAILFDLYSKKFGLNDYNKIIKYKSNSKRNVSLYKTYRQFLYKNKNSHSELINCYQTLGM